MQRNRTLRRETTHGRIGGRSRHSIEGARELRREMTPAEQLLWQALRRHRVGGQHFRRQHPVGPFVLDFACAAQRLGIEVDGAVHEDQADQDQARTDILAEFGWRVVRFMNHEVMNELSRVVAEIEAAVAAPSSNPSPAARGGGKRSADGHGTWKTRADVADFAGKPPSPRIGGGAGGGGHPC